MRKRITVILLVLSVLLGSSAAAPAPAAAYNWPGGYWASGEVSDNQLEVCFADNTSPTFTNRATILAGMNVWGQATDIDFVDTTDVFGLCLSSDIRVAWTTTNGDPAEMDAPAAGEIGTLDFTFNSALGSSAYYWSASGPVTGGLLDVYDIGAHEAGHALGLGHVDERSGANVTEFNFNALCSGTYKWDITCTYPTSPKNMAGRIYAGSLDAGVGNFSSSPKPTLAAAGYHFDFYFANDSLARNPSGVKLEIYQGSTLRHTTPFTTGTLDNHGTADLTWTSSAEFRFRVQYSKSSIDQIYAFPTINTTPGHQLMEPWIPHCYDQSQRVITLSDDDAAGIAAIYPSHAIVGVWGTDIICS